MKYGIQATLYHGTNLIKLDKLQKSVRLEAIFATGKDVSFPRKTTFRETQPKIL